MNGLCLADVAAYGACIREHNHDGRHRDANGYEFSSPIDWGTRVGTLEGALANIVNECELPSSQQMPLTALASVAAYARDVLARTAEPVRERYIIGPDGAACGPFAVVPTGTGWPVT